MGPSALLFLGTYGIVGEERRRKKKEVK